ncbi:hypothetical protein HANVADRAFT_51035 [Hanseniaspora valbyensis NRRL Y-1626]|uniref:Tr-type G domain-containing protein n=1 Tax=Hanseniaspora valbyensis NRRL Y-1626 TaxID=766949 RepID=A0A1B7TK45_9ASCO|nr:hypothetical protein HANVADRAFT_51035 [Hanseniaspora valbyensis NRRL Y-1626]
MLRLNLTQSRFKYAWTRISISTLNKRSFHETVVSANHTNIALKDKRNIGIIAHIDAGKTTTTERLLYYTNNKTSIGNVDDGNTTTDYLKEEKARGITIQSACISIFLKNKLINVIDTPGHIDFTYEVIKALKILDSAVLILDSKMGVETQTLKVFQQAKNLPKICYINKMDTLGHNFNKCIKDIMVKLETKPLILTYPIFSLDTIGLDKSQEEDLDNEYILTEENKNDLSLNDKFVGTLDVLNKCATIYKPDDPNYLKVYHYDNLNSVLKEKLKLGRESFIEALTSLDSDLLDFILESEIEDYLLDEKLTTSILNKFIKQLTIDKSIIPVICGSSFQNIGIQSLIQGVLEYLPSPIDAHGYPELEFQKKKIAIEFDTKKNSLSVLGSNEISIGQVFKIIKYPMLGNLIFFRVYSGKFKSNSKVFNSTQYNMLLNDNSTTRKNNDLKSVGDGYQIKQLYLMQGNIPIKTSELNVGDIGCISERPLIEQLQISSSSNFEELKSGNINSLSTGDTIVTTASPSGFRKFEKILPNEKKQNTGSKIFLNELSTLKFTPLSTISHPYKVSVQLLNPNKFQELIAALLEIIKFDPSINFQYDELMGQIILEGLGELQLEIVVKRLLDSNVGEDAGYGLNDCLTIGDINVSYMETLKPGSESPTWHQLKVPENNFNASLDNIINYCSFEFKFKKLCDNSMEDKVMQLDELKNDDFTLFRILGDEDDNYLVIPSVIIEKWSAMCQITTDQFISCVKSSCLSICSQGGLFKKLPLRSMLFILNSENFEIKDDIKDLSSLSKIIRMNFEECLQINFKSSNFEVQEPYINGLIKTEETYVTTVTHDLSSKRLANIEYIGADFALNDSSSNDKIIEKKSEIENYNKTLYIPKFNVGDPNTTIDLFHQNNIGDGVTQSEKEIYKFIKFKAPLRKMTGYMTTLRKLTQGKCSFDLEVYGYDKMNENDANKLEQ